MECVAIVQPADVPIPVMWQLERDTSHVPAGLDYPRGGRLEMDQDPEGQSREYDKQFLPYSRYGHCRTGREYCFKQSHRLSLHVGEGLQPHSL